MSGRPPAADVRELIHAVGLLVTRVEALHVKVDQVLTRLPGPRDAADTALLVAIVEAVGNRAWTAAELWRHRAVNQQLAHALDAADIDNARQLGKLCYRLQGRPTRGLMLVRVGADREGIIWRITHVCESETRKLDPAQNW